jgi:putative exosortase-associated protein (TIGR04073 family)
MRIKILLWMILLTVISASSVSAEETAGDYMYGVGTKFGRGLENVVTSPAEIPCTIHADMKNQGGTGFFSGFGKGTLFMLRRMFVGVTEVGSFFIPMERTIPRVCQEAKPAIA